MKKKEIELKMICYTYAITILSGFIALNHNGKEMNQEDNTGNSL